MKIIENLTPNRKIFLRQLGIINDNDIPLSFYEKIQSFNRTFSESEKFCLSDYNICFSNKSLFCIKDLIGTSHERYAGKTWLDAFCDLDRAEENLEYFLNERGSDYYDNDCFEEGLKTKGSKVGVVKRDGKYFIFDQNGGGNNRLILMKIRYLALVSKCNSQSDIEELNKKFSYYAQVRTIINQDIADSIFYLMFPNGDFKESGYYVTRGAKSTEDRPCFNILSGNFLNRQIVQDHENISIDRLKEFRRQLEMKKHTYDEYDER